MDRSADVLAHFAATVRRCRRLDWPFAARLVESLARGLDPDTAFARRILAWPGDVDADELALRACAALNGLVRAGVAPELAAVWPPAVWNPATADVALALAVSRHDTELAAALDRAPPADDVALSAVLLGGALIVAERTGLPVDLLGVAAPTGLALRFDEHLYDLGVGAWGAHDAPVHLVCDWRGSRPPLGAELIVASRAGCDADPLDVADAGERRRLLSWIWPDQHARLARMDEALAAVETVAIERADPADWIERRLAEPPIWGRTRLIVQVFSSPRLDASARDRIGRAIAEAGAAATAETPVCWLRVERDAADDTAAVSLASWPPGTDREIGRADLEGRRVAWTAGPVRHAYDGA